MRQYDRGVRWETEHLDVHGTRWVAMYLPVWLYSFYQEGKSSSMVHYIAVNGRTGETMGSVPVSHGRLLLPLWRPNRVGSHRDLDSGDDVMTPLLIDLLIALQSSSNGSGWILLAGPAGAAGTYWALYQYYRNTNKSHDFEHDTVIESQTDHRW